MIKTRIICTIGDVRKDLDREDYESEGKYKAAVKQKLASNIHSFIEAGMNVARINMAHYDIDERGTWYIDKDYLEDLIQTIRDSRKAEATSVAIMGDIQGPKVRLAGFGDEIKVSVRNETGSLLKVLILKEECLQKWEKGKEGEDLVIGVRWEGGFDFVRNVRVNQTDTSKDLELHIGDTGPILRAIKFIEGDAGILCEVKPGAGQTRIEESVSFGKRDGVSVKNSSIDPGDYVLDGKHYLKDMENLEFLLGKNDVKDNKLLVDFIALSFVKSNIDVLNLQKFIKKTLTEKVIWERFKMRDFPIISKIEDQQGIDNLNQIIKESYGVMVARGDMGLHCPIETVAKHQKNIIDQCNQKERPAIVATQMLESMIKNAEPSRAETTDVFNAVIDGADAVMLSGETAKGRYPKESIKMMASIIKQAEDYLQEKKDYSCRIGKLQENIVESFRKERDDLIARRPSIGEEEFRELLSNLELRENAHQIAYSACEKACQLDCGAIVALTESGGTAKQISRYKPETRLIAGVYTEQAVRVLMLSYGVEPILIKRQTDQFFEFEDAIAQANLPRHPPRESRRAITVAGYPRQAAGAVTFLNILHYETKR